MQYLPSLYSALRSLTNGVLAAPHVGILKLLHDPLKVLYFAFGLHTTVGAHLLLKSSFVTASTFMCKNGDCAYIKWKMSFNCSFIYKQYLSDLNLERNFDIIQLLNYIKIYF